MLSKVNGLGLLGLDGFKIEVETDVSFGLPKFDIVGLPDTAVKESKERVHSAIKNSGKKFPDGVITINLAPADIKKEGAYLDLPIAIGIIKASSDLIEQDISDYVMLGELSLDGVLRGINGILPLLISAKNQGFNKFIIPKANEKEAEYIEGIEVYACLSLNQAIGHLNGSMPIEMVQTRQYNLLKDDVIYQSDLKFVKGQQMAKRALEVAVSGGHNILLVGSPGAGKTMLAKCIPTIMPDMSFDEALETTKIHSVAGLLKGEGIVFKRPFFTPHHTATNVSLIGGGTGSKPGIISLAHNGVLYLDELPEYTRSCLESLRQPLEDRVVTVSRAKATVSYPASFILVGSMNPCPCGNYGSKTVECRCTASQIAKYKAKISGPLLDRIDLQIEVDNVKYEDLTSEVEEESSYEVKKRVDRTRNIQRERFKNEGIKTNSEMGERQLKKYCKLSPECEQIMRVSFEKLNLSARGRSRILKVARTISDLALSENILPEHILEAVSYRSYDINS